jgi:hypothetical protein
MLVHLVAEGEIVSAGYFVNGGNKAEVRIKAWSGELVLVLGSAGAPAAAMMPEGRRGRLNVEWGSTGKFLAGAPDEVLAGHADAADATALGERFVALAHRAGMLPRVTDGPGGEDEHEP